MQFINKLLECNENTLQSDSGTLVGGYDGARFYFAAYIRYTALVSLLVRHCINVVSSLVYQDLLYPRSTTSRFRHLFIHLLHSQSLTLRSLPPFGINSFFW